MNQRQNKRLRQLGSFALTLPVLVLIYLPVSWLIMSSTSTRTELLATPPRWIPAQPSLQNYLDILFPGADASTVAKTFKSTLQNSLFVASVVTVVSVVFGSMAAYSLVR